MQELFKQYRHNRKLLDRRIGELASAGEVTDVVSGSSPEWPYTQHPVTVCGRNAGDEQRLRQEIAILRRDCRIVERVMEQAPNSSIRLMLELKYVDGLKWEEVAAEMGEDITGGAMRKRAEDFFEKIKVSSENSGNSVFDVL